jgi:elongation factor G
MLISGQGELHLEILRDRIELEYDLNAELGPMRVAYRESVSEPTEFELEFNKVIGKQSMYCKLKLSVESTLDEFDPQELQK